LIQTAKLHGLDPFAFLKEALERRASGRAKAYQVDQLQPRHWRSESTH
jgi:hypothetical protein